MRLIQRTTQIFTIGVLAASAPLAAQLGPAPVMTHLPREVIELACAPRLVPEAPTPSLVITGGQDSFTRYSYGPGDLITINGGSDNGIDVGQEYFVRRVQGGRGSISPANPATIRTAGWVRVYAVDKTMSLVTVSHACDTLNVGDYLEPFALPEVPVADANPAKPQRDNYGRVMSGTDRRTSFGTGDFFLVDRGTDQGVAVGDRFIVYRYKGWMERANKSNQHVLPKDIVPDFLYELGEAFVVDVKPGMSTLKVMQTRDAILEGDLVALRK